MSDSTKAPAAPRRPQETETHGDVRVDDWAWLREKENPEVVSLLEAENEHTKAVLTETGDAQDRLFEEFRSRIQETDLSVPVRKDDWWYYSRTEEGKQYGIHCRRADQNGEITPEDQEVVFFDTNVEAGDGFFAMGTFDVSPGAYLLAYSVDRDGDELFDLRFRDLKTGKDLDDVIENAHYGGAWAKDDSAFFYTRPDETQRPFQVWRHVLGTSVQEDELMLQEDDGKFFVGVGNSRTEDWIMAVCSSSLTSEVHLLRADRPMEAFRVAEPRRPGIEYGFEHHKDANGERFYIVTNEDAPNFKLMQTPCEQPARANWEEVIAHRPDVKLDDVEAFARHLVLSERQDAHTQIAVIELASGNRRVLEQDEDVYTVGVGGNATFDTDVVRFEYTSLVTPRTLYRYDMRTGERVVLKQQPVLGGHDPADYVTLREWATAADGTKVPISIVYKKDRGTSAGPALLGGYGSYEISSDPTFSILRLSLLQRGVLVAIAHVRGGGDLGRMWYENGKFFDKKNTFTDFVSCAQHLVDSGYTTPSQLVARGGSAGGLLMGAAINLRPDLFGGVIADVPFVDALNTMLDASLPLTVNEYEEWGDPNDKAVYDYMKSYAPYENVTDAAFPKILAACGLNDPRVGYWEAAKWVQKLRSHNTGENPVLLKVEMGAGHMGPSGRYNAWKDEAFFYTFILWTLGLKV